MLSKVLSINGITIKEYKMMGGWRNLFFSRVLAIEYLKFIGEITIDEALSLKIDACHKSYLRDCSPNKRLNESLPDSDNLANRIINQNVKLAKEMGRNR